MVFGSTSNPDPNRQPDTTTQTLASLGTAVSGQSVSTSGSAGSPTAIVCEKTFLQLNHLDIQGEEAVSPTDVGSKKKRKGQRVSAEKSGRGLRQFSLRVCEKVESKGCTTYNEVADELVSEFSTPASNGNSPDQQQYNEKNIRRRVYDALNVLKAMNIISNDKKEIHWKGLPRSSLNDMEKLKTEHQGLNNRIGKKVAYLQELEEQHMGIQSLIHRNEQQFKPENAPSGVVALPFIIVQTRPNATVEVEISEDTQLVHLDFNGTPFELHDDNFVLKSMKFPERPLADDMEVDFIANRGEGFGHAATYKQQKTSPPSVKTPGRPPSLPVRPGIIKSRVKQEK